MKRFIVEPMQLINTAYSEYSPTVSHERESLLFFTGQRESDNCNIYKIDLEKSDTISDAIPLNTVHHEADPHIQGSIIIYTKCPIVKKAISSCSLQSCTLTSSGQILNCSPIVLSGMADSIYAFGQGVISPDHRRLVFSARLMEGEHRDTDLWISNWNNTTDNWSMPVKLGSNINTSRDEMFPYIDASGTLYFSSPSQQGDLDIYMANPILEFWGNPVLLPEPFNSDGDDFGIIILTNGHSGYFTSSRTGGVGSDDIYKFFIE